MIWLLIIINIMFIGWVSGKYVDMKIKAELFQEDYESIDYELKNGTVESLMRIMRNSNFKK